MTVEMSDGSVGVVWILQLDRSREEKEKAKETSENKSPRMR